MDVEMLHARFHPAVWLVVIVCLAAFATARAAENRTRLLESESLTCCALAEYPTVFPAKSRAPHGLDGLAVHYLDALRTRLGLRCSSMHVYDTTNTSFTGFITRLEACARNKSVDSVCRCELGVGAWMVTRRRAGRVRFVSPFAMTALHVSALGPDESGWQEHGFVSSISALIVFLCVAMFTVAMLGELRRAFSMNSFQRLESMLRPYVLPAASRSCSFDLVSSFYHGSGYASLQKDSLNRACRLLAFLASFLFIVELLRSSSHRVTQTALPLTVESFRDCEIDPTDVCLAAGDAADDIWSAWRVPETCPGRGDAKRLQSNAAAIQAVQRRECKYAITSMRGSVWLRREKDCHRMTPPGPSLSTGDVSFVLGPSVSERVARTLDVATVELREERMLRSMEDYADDIDVCTDCERGRLTEAQRSVRSSLGMAWLLSFFMALVIVSGNQSAHSILCKHRDEEGSTGSESSQ